MCMNGEMTDWKEWRHLNGDIILASKKTLNPHFLIEDGVLDLIVKRIERGKYGATG